jgi:hypothetical protein
MLLQRIFASMLLVACLSLVLMAWPYQAPFSYEPIGPRAFPLLMLGLMGRRSNTPMKIRRWIAKP